MIPQPGEKYRHYKNGLEYEIIDIAFHTETEEELVIYKPQYDAEHLANKNAHVYARPLSMFIEEVEWQGKRVPRFEKI